MTKSFYKKIFIITATLFIFFAPVGMTIGNTSTHSVVVHGSSMALSSYSAFRPSFNLNLAEATGTQSSPPTTYNLFTSPVTSAVYYVALTVDKIMTWAVVLGAFLVRLGLQFNGNIFNSPEVQTGFSVTLAIANLGFVLGIIIIAIATILRNQTYGIKQLLAKLVFMAILVNFGLVIMAPIVGFADSMSNYFVNATSPSAATGGYEGYVTTMAQAFAPQTMTPANSVTSTSCSGAAAGTGTAAICNLQTNVGNATQAGSPDSLTQEVLAMVFGIVFLAMTALTFFCLALLLVVRYLILAGLLIVLPLAWLTYVFPKFDNSFSKWWNNFIKWTFFPPLALFFIYLAFTTAANTGGLATQNAYLKQAAGLPQGAQQGPEGALVYQTGLGGAIQQAADEILLVGLTIMGLMFALSLSGKAGSTVVNGASTASKAAAGYVGRKGKQAVGDRLRTAGRKTNAAGETTTSLQRIGSRMQGIPFFRGVGSKVAATGSQTLFHEEKKEEIKKFSDTELKALDNKGVLSRANSKTVFINPVEAAAIAQELAKRNLTGSLPPDRLKRFLDNSEKMGNVQSILNNRPELAAQTSAAKPKIITDPITGATRPETAAEATVRAISDATKKIKIADVVDINYKSMGDPAGTAPLTDEQKAVAISMSVQQLRKLITEGSDNQTKAYKDTINRMMAAAATPGAPPMPAAAANTLDRLHAHVNTNPEWVLV